MKRSNIFVHLTGGLGNQLFQVAAALSENPFEINLHSQLGKPRANAQGKPEIFSFIFPAKVKESNLRIRFPNFSEKVAGYTLRIGVSPRKLEKFRLYQIAVTSIASLIMSINSKRFLNVVQSRGVGFSRIKTRRGNNYLIGYFQSFVYSDLIKDQLMKLEVREIGPDLQALKSDAVEDNPLVVHFRFGDYLKEDFFGLPSEVYYRNAIEELWSTGSYGKIWVFSDELNRAKSKFPIEYLEFVRWIETVDNSSAATLETMRHGAGYVIANSTFSWWGAYLSYYADAPVIAPTPWFQGMDSPLNLIPSNWKSRPL